MLISILGLNPIFSNASNLCSTLFSQSNRSEYQVPSKQLEIELEKQLETTRQRSKIRKGSINLSRQFKGYSSYLPVRFQNEKTQNIIVFGRPYLYKGERVIDFAFDIDSPVLNRVSITTLLKAALSAELRRDLEDEYSMTLLPTNAVGGRKNNFQVFEFKRWVDSARTQIEVASIYGEKKFISVGEYFEGLLIADQDLIREIRTFYLSGGRGRLFYNDAELNPSFHGLSILLSSWPKDAIKESALFREIMNKDLVQSIIAEKIPVIYSLDERDYKGAAGQDTQTGRYIKNRTGIKNDSSVILLVSDKTKPDTIVHERQHIEDYVTNGKKDLMKKLRALIRDYEQNTSNKLRIPEYRLLFKYALNLILEQRAYHAQATFIYSKIEKGEIDSYNANIEILKLNKIFTDYYVARYISMANQFRESGSRDIVDRLNKLIQGSILQSDYIPIGLE